MVSSVFYRDLYKTPINIVGGKGVYLYDENGKEYLDAVGGSCVAAIGHGVKEICDSFCMKELYYVYGGGPFTSKWQEALAHSIIDMAPKNMRRVYFVSGGSEANETAIKMARHYFLQRGKPMKQKVIARWMSYHGCTVGTLSLSGRTSWREYYTPYLFEVPRIMPPYCYRCPFNSTYPDCDVACAQQLEQTILLEGPENIAAFIAEPIIGATVTGVVPVKEYYSKIRQICDKYDVLFIVDEVLTGYGRTGLPFAIQHWDVEPDIITIAKGMGSGYVPLGAVIASEKVVDAFMQGDGKFMHGFTYSGNPISCYIGLQVKKYMDDNDLFSKCANMGFYLKQYLSDLASRHTVIGDVRGKGLFVGLEIVKDPETKEPFAPELDLARMIAYRALESGVFISPGVKGANYGLNGDHIMISPPYVINNEEMQIVIEVLDNVISSVEQEFF
jgi:adenosylmethionine-8-amino-7-oxononanoate aminotransferase